MEEHIGNHQPRHFSVDSVVTVLEITVSHWPFSDQFQHLANQNPFWSAKFTFSMGWELQGRIQGGVSRQWLYINYIIIYCNYSHYYFKRSALYPTESYRCMNLLAAVPAAQQLYS